MGLIDFFLRRMTVVWQVGVTAVTAVPSSPGVYVLGISDVFWTAYNASRLASIATGNYISIESPTLNGGVKLTSNHVRPLDNSFLKMDRRNGLQRAAMGRFTAIQWAIAVSIL